MGRRPVVARQIEKLLRGFDCGHSNAFETSAASSTCVSDSTAAAAAAVDFSNEDEADLAGHTADAVTTEAILAMQRAEAAAGGALATGQGAIICKRLADVQGHLLQSPNARGAALALTALNGASVVATTAGLPNDAVEALREAERGCRDAVVLRCWRRHMAGDRGAFLTTVEEALGGGRLSIELRAQILLAYKKVVGADFTTRRSLQRSLRPRRARTAPPLPHSEVQPMQWCKPPMHVDAMVPMSVPMSVEHMEHVDAMVPMSVPIVTPSPKGGSKKKNTETSRSQGL